MRKKDRQAQATNISLVTALMTMALAAAFFFAGWMGNSIAVIAEGMDNLLDAVGSVLLIAGFAIAAREKDNEHPNGHGRIEYIMGLLLSELILVAAFSLGKESILRILHPETMTMALPMIIVSLLAIVAKLVMVCLVEQKNKTVASPALSAYCKNAKADIKGIVLVLLSPLLHQFTSLPIDGIIGLVVALIIAADGGASAIENISLLLGKGLSYQDKQTVDTILKPYDQWIQLKTLKLHDYGPTNCELVVILTVRNEVETSRLNYILTKCHRQIEEALNFKTTIYGENKRNDFRVSTMNQNSITLYRPSVIDINRIEDTAKNAQATA